MAISISEQYPGKTAGNTTNYPLGEARNVTVTGDGTGTPWEQAIVNDDQGLKQALLAAAGITPSGVPDTAVESQYLQALQKLFAGSITAVLSTDGEVKIPVVVGVTPRVLIIKWGKSGNINDEGTAQIIFPAAFPNAMLTGFLTENRATTYADNASHGAILNESKTGFRIFFNSTLPVNSSFNWLAIGW